MYCYHCGKYFDQHKIEAKQSSYALKDQATGELLEIDSDARIDYICPRCGHLSHEGASEEDLKHLSMAAHSQLQRGANFFASGMGFALLGIIVGALAFTFLLLSYQTSGGKKVLNTDVSTFYIFVVMAIIAAILLVYGLVNVVIGIRKRIIYSKLLKDLNNRTFVQ